jgi:hypothetical protein
MTDQELTIELRNSKGWPNLGNAAADRIEQLLERTIIKGGFWYKLVDGELEMIGMTDEELIKRLRAWDGSPFYDDAHEAAARIEKLLESIKNLSHLWATVAVNREVSEGKLEKAVGALHQISLGSQNSGVTKESLGREARTVLAELEKTE